MDFELTDEQRWLAESAGELVRREAADGLWGALVEFGALEVAPREGGLGAVDVALTARAVGGQLASVPLVATAAVRHVAGVAALESPAAAVALCVGESSGRFDPMSPSTAMRDGGVHGEKIAVPFAGQADVLAVSVATESGPDLALVPRTAPGVSVSAREILDPTLAAADVHLDGAPASRILGVSPERVAAVAAVLASAEAVGAAAAVLDLAREYASQRRQFGATIGSFQAIRHLLADMVVGVESSWSSVLFAAASLDEEEPDDLRTAAVAKAWTSRATLDVAHGALQVFGGIAFTAEHPAHRFLRRIASLGAQYGSAADHERGLGRALAGQMEVLT